MLIYTKKAWKTFVFHAHFTVIGSCFGLLNLSFLLHEVLAHLHAAIAVNTLHDVHTLGSIVLLTSVDVINGYAYHLVVLNRLNTRPEVVAGIVEVGTAVYYLDAELVDEDVRESVAPA